MVHTCCIVCTGTRGALINVHGTSGTGEARLTDAHIVGAWRLGGHAEAAIKTRVRRAQNGVGLAACAVPSRGTRARVPTHQVIASTAIETHRKSTLVDVNLTQSTRIPIHTSARKEVEVRLGALCAVLARR